MLNRRIPLPPADARVGRSEPEGRHADVAERSEIFFADMSVTHPLAIAVETTTQCATATCELTQKLALC